MLANISEYVPTYINFDSRAWTPWIISASIDAKDGKVIEIGSSKYGGIKDISPNLFRNILLVLIITASVVCLFRFYLRGGK